ncbi:MAG: holo-ACP synthase [Candidatus Omnitrophota bacterium]
MIIGIGTDIVEVERIKSAAEKSKEKFLNRIFTSKEIMYSFKKNYPYIHLAARFAAKEAVYKAFGDSLLNGSSWKDIEIQNKKNGKPVVMLRGNARKLKSKKNVKEVIISLSHTRNYATATAILIGT